MNREKYSWLYDVLFLLVLLLAGYLRLTGLDWGELQHQHPDELFLTGVLGNLQAKECSDPAVPPEACPADQKHWISIADYFNTKKSTLNPYNRGQAFFVYGDLPMILTRIGIELDGDLRPTLVRICTEIYSHLPLTWIHNAIEFFSKDIDIKYFARQTSAGVDLLSIFLLYLIVSRLYGKRVGLLASLFSALTVMQIQQSHFFTTDLFTNFFMLFAIWFAVAIVEHEAKSETTNIQREAINEPPEDLEPLSPDSELPSTELPITNPELRITKSASRILRDPLFLLSIAFGLALGLAMASKINAAPLAILLPIALAIRLYQSKQKLSEIDWTPTAIFLAVGALATIISFRVFQPYAFDGIKINPQWIANMRELRNQATGTADLPWNLQWARRSHLFSFMNLTVWGLGLPLGILAWIGFLYMGWRILKGETRHLLLWGWTAVYFLWQSMQFNATMRYQLPIYPLLAMMAAWFVFETPRHSKLRITNYAIGLAGVIVIILTGVWAFAFHTIYLNPEPRVAASRWIYQNVPGPINVEIQTDTDATYNQPLPFPIDGTIASGTPYDTSFSAQKDGIVNSITLGHATNSIAPTSTLSLILSNNPNPTSDQILATASITSDFSSEHDPRGNSYTLNLDKPVAVTKGTQYFLHIQISDGALSLAGAAIANETDYDWSLPFRIDAYDGFGGIYRGDLNLQVYWDDNADKLTRFTDTLDQTDFIFIPTNHQYGQITRLPERYPLTAYYYRELIGCPAEKDIIWCYRVAEPGMFKGRLGFDLVKVFEDYPTLGPLVINDQSAEEAFTFYDHPKVLIFKKSPDYSPEQVQASLASVDLTRAIHLTPKQFNGYKNLLLPADKLAIQRAGGTWSELFSYNSIQNRYPVIGLIIWYVFIFLLGLIIYPIARLAFPGLADKGYALSRGLGLVIFGYLVWIGGSTFIPATHTNITIIFGLWIVVSAALAYYQRAELIEEWRTKRTYFLVIEGVFLAFFLIDLFIRVGNPDLWHPAKGGERPMDFSYFNAVIKSTTFPPYDPWFAGGYINYYYYGFVLVAMPVKLLGIVPTIAYNFILPTLFAIVGITAFSIGWNLMERDKADASSSFILHPSSLLSGFFASLLSILLGNLGTVQLIYQKLQELGAAGNFSWTSTLSERLTWAFNGLMMNLKGASLPIGPGDWYWNPSRVIPPGGGNEITEFPLFTFIYSDLHAHMIVMPLALLTLCWALSAVASRARWKNQFSALIGFVIGGLIIGAVYPTNLSDSYTYLLIGLTAVGYSILRYADVSQWMTDVSPIVKRMALTGLALFGLTALSYLLYEPYRAWYSQAYSAVDLWKGPYTPIMSYLTHWGLLLFIVASWMVWETHQWMAETPVSTLTKLRPYQLLIEGLIVLFVLALLALAYNGITIGWIALPLATWAGILLLRPSISDMKRLALFWIGTALLISIVVELVSVRGDIGRMNTIFKFYMQAWLIMTVSAGTALTWLLLDLSKWNAGWRNFWQSAMIVLLACAAMYTVTASAGKIKDRWIVEAPRTLDSMTFMQYAHYDDFGQRMDLSEDYRAIRWMQDNVKGSPVIVEANCPEYRWCTRFTIYTGLPGVVGWNWHQRQQRAYMPNWVTDRVDEITSFYTTPSVDEARAFLKKYDVKYIVVGQLERAEYSLPVPSASGASPFLNQTGLVKFEQYDGDYWRTVYHDGSTTIYEVMP